ncbi:hypothetical protein HDG34_005836 [Paraburkholderia sp. HC6.4b]|nr:MULTISPECIES: hypothetical protein [unclassified Paraburkholderia]MBB5411870.1 hypothetical protein [Paraburkholderia sp. HC6.4b]MBB5450182.1 hypothetical protein [Paraburkholderia sp. Kb1A]
MTDHDWCADDADRLHRLVTRIFGACFIGSAIAFAALAFFRG